jgi:hypothetical protein
MNRNLTALLAPVLLVASLSACSSDEQGVELLADTIAGQTLTVLESPGTATIWVSSPDGSDPRPGGEPDPGLCTVSGPGTPRLTEPRQGNEVLGDTRLYALAQVEELQPQVSISCTGAGFKHVYVGN